MPAQTRRRHQQGEESRLRILDAAFEIASERGYDGTTLALVTKRAGLPASSVYWQFKNKDELLAEAIEHNYASGGGPARPGRKAGAQGRRHAGRDRDAQPGRRPVSQPQFQRLGLMLALERRAVEATARARFRKVRDDTITMMTHWWGRVLSDQAVARHPQAPRELAQLMIAMSDGLLIATQADESLDIERMINLLIIAMRAVTASYEADAVPTRRKRASSAAGKGGGSRSSR